MTWEHCCFAMGEKGIGFKDSWWYQVSDLLPNLPRGKGSSPHACRSRQGEGGEQSLSKWESRAKHGITLQFLKGRTYLTSTFAHGSRDNQYLYFSTRLTPMDELLGLPKQRRCLPSGPGGKIFGSWNSMWAASVESRSWLGCVLGYTLVC